METQVKAMEKAIRDQVAACQVAVSGDPDMRTVYQCLSEIKSLSAHDADLITIQQLQLAELEQRLIELGAIIARFSDAATGILEIHQRVGSVSQESLLELRRALADRPGSE